MSEAERPAPTGPVLGIFAHPDDAEIAAGATLAKWVAAGRETHLLVLTNGDRGSSDPERSRVELAATRRAETEAAARALGLATVRILSTHDGELENTQTVREAVIRRVREVRAETVVSVDPTAVFFGTPEGTTTYYNHSDHRTAGWIALDSVFPGSGNPHFFSEHLGEGLDVQEVRDVWLGWTNEPNRIEPVDAESFRKKVDSLGCHASQITEGIAYWGETLGKDARRLGEKIGVEFAEEFRVLDLS
jgi:LmbE family N-acetylglucosaminyl deacetylase